MTEAVPVPREMVERMWPHCQPHIERAVKASKGWTVDGVLDDLRRGRCLLWAVLRDRTVIGAGISEIHGDVASLSLVGGRQWRQWRDQIATIEKWAREAGCTSMEFDGRRGWTKLMAKDGYVPCGSGMRKDL